MRRTVHTLGVLALVVLTGGTAAISAARGQGRGYGSPRFVPLSGTYQLETSRSETPEVAADRATRGLPGPVRDRAYHNILRRLEPPDMLSIDRDRNGRTFTICSTTGPRATFDADGVTRPEQGPNGRTMMTQVAYVGDRLSISTTGDRETDYRVTFQALDLGRTLLVTRRLDNPDLRQPVTTQTYYRKIGDQPRWDLYAPAQLENRSGGYGRADEPRREAAPFVIPDGTRIIAVLDTGLSTRTSRSGERFTMTVQGPDEYRGLRIDGVVARITPRGPGREADLRVDFDTIHLRDGRSAAFDAVLDSARTPGGGTLRVDASGGDPNRDRTSDTIQNGALGAALGAVIGAIAGGGKGAAIGAVVGGAGGAILSQNRDADLDLPPGTEVTLLVRPRRDPTP